MNYKDYRVVTTHSDLVNLVRKPEFYSGILLEENLVIVELSRNSVFLDKPRYLGQTILDDSKCQLYDFHYGVIQKIFGASNTRLLLTDTDSVAYEIKSYKNPSQLLYKHAKETIDFSNYDKSSPYYSTHNKLVPGKIKDEYGGRIILEIIALR